MKIISKFQDYYDIGIAYGVDEKLRFERVTQVVSDTRVYGGAYIRHSYSKDNTKYRVTFYYNHIGFCGRVYPFVHMCIEKVKKQKKILYYEHEEDIYVFDREDFKRKLLLMGIESEEILLSKTWEGNTWKRQNILKIVKDFFLCDRKDFKKLFDTYKEVYFVVEHYCIEENEHTFLKEKITLLPQLKQYKFAKAVPPMQAFQEISMYLGKINSLEDNTVTIDDKYLAQGKGFDCYSFKKMPSKRKVKDC